MMRFGSGVAGLAIGALLMVGCTAKGHAPDVAGGRVEIGEGTFLVYDVNGEGPGVVLIHGGMLDRRMWDAQLASLKRRFRVVRYDTRWHGKSSGSSGPWADEEDLRILLDHVGLERAALVGLSMGGRIAIDFALRHPDRVSAIVAISPGLSGFGFPDTSGSPQMAAMGAAWQRGDVEGVAEPFQRLWTDGPRREPGDVDPKVRARVREMARVGIARAFTRPRTPEMDPPAVGRLKEIHAPLLALRGELDMPDIRTITDKLAAEVTGARLIVVPGAAHMVNMEKPDEVNREIVGFLSATLSGS
jgi:pimeloyl-ACP methyl ester carboxylesterase